MSNDGRVWHVRSYPAGAILHTTDTYDAAEQWRRANDMVSVIIPEWPGHQIPVFTGFSDMFGAMQAGHICPGDQVGCAHCPWMGITRKFASHLLCCPDQTATS